MEGIPYYTQAWLISAIDHNSSLLIADWRMLNHYTIAQRYTCITLYTEVFGGSETLSSLNSSDIMSDITRKHIIR